MSDATSKGTTLWQDLKMPPLTHCSIQRACELLNVKKSDIFNWFHELRPVISLNQSIMELILVITPDDEKFKSITGEQLLNAISMFSGYELEPLRPFTLDFMDSILDEEARVFLHVPAYVSGYMHVIDGLSLYNKNSLLLSVNELYGEIPIKDKDGFIRYLNGSVESLDTLIVHSLGAYNEDYNSIVIDIDDVYISGRDLEKIHEAGKRGEKFYRSGNSKIDVKVKNTSVSERTGNLTSHQFRMIYPLLKIAGITDEEIKNQSPAYLNKKLAEIGKANGVQMPQPDKNTWKKWIEKLEMVMRP